jgi:hypothetical protein
MNRSLRILVPVLALLLVVTGSVLATKGGRGDEHRSPVAASHEPGASPAEVEASDGDGPSDALLDRLVERLAAAGIDTDAETLAGLAADYGVGGAVRLLTWADATGTDVSEIAAMFDSGMGWGEIMHELDADGSLGVTPGLGWVIGQGNANGQGQAKAEAHRP